MGVYSPMNRGRMHRCRSLWLDRCSHNRARPEGRRINVLLAGKNFGFTLHVSADVEDVQFVILEAQRLDTNDEPFQLFAEDPFMMTRGRLIEPSIS